MSLSHRLPIAVLALALVGAAPGAAKTPKPRQSLAAWARDWQKAGRTGDCTFLGGVYHFKPSDSTSCSFYTSRLAGLTVLGTDQFGTGGIVRWDAPNSLGGVAQESVLWSKRTSRSRWDDTSTVTGVFGYVGINSIGTRPAHVKAFGRAAAKYVRILRTKDCTGLYALEQHPQHSTEAAQCRGTFQAAMRKLLAKAPKAKPVRLGGNRYWAVYGVDLGPKFMTIPLRFEPDGKIRVLTWYYS